MHVSDESDSSLLARYQKTGDEGAFAELVRRHRPTTIQAALRITRNRHDAEDIAQACFTELAINPAVVRSSVPGYLRASAVHLALNLTRAQRRRKRRESAVEPRKQNEPQDVEAAQAASAAAENLPSELRSLVEMHFVQELEQEEIARRLGVSQSTVSRRLARAIEQLRRQLQFPAPAPAAAMRPRGPGRRPRSSCRRCAPMAMAL